MDTQASYVLRHRLASLFDPGSVLVISDQKLPVFNSLPATLKKNSQLVKIKSNEPIKTGITWQPDLAVICVPPVRLEECLQAIRPLGPRSVLVLRHSIASENPAADAYLCKKWGKANNSIILGPNSFGLQRPGKGYNFGLDSYLAPSGRVALVTQSTSIMAAVLDWAEDINMGFSALLSVGVDSPIDVSEVLDFLSMDNRTDSIVLHLEHPLSSRRFTSALHAAASIKPVVVLKAGRYPANPDSDLQQRAAATSSVLNALLRRTGAVRVRYFIQMFSALKVLVHRKRPKGRRVAIVSNGLTAARLALDMMGPNTAVKPADLAQTTRTELEALLEPHASSANPVITRRPLQPDYFEKVLQCVADDANTDGVLVLLAPDNYTNMEAIADRLASIAGKHSKPLICCFMGDASMRELRHRMDKVGAPAFRTPESAVEAFGLLASYHYSQTLALQSLSPEPLSWPPRVKDALGIIQNAISDGRLSLSADESSRLMECFYIPVELTTNRDTESQLEVPPLAIRMQRHKRFGPYMSFGASRTIGWVQESLRAADLPPLNRYLARQLVQRSILWEPVLERQLNPDELELLYEAIERVSDMVCELPMLESISIDPLYADSRLMQTSNISINLVANANEVTLPTGNFGYNHLAIHPYPRKLVQEQQFKNGDSWVMRPIRPEDAQLLQDFVRNLSDQSRYMRFVSMMRELTPRMLARYTSIDYDRELALVATITEPDPQHRGYPKESIIGFAHYLRNADGLGAEYALAIADEWQRHGLGAQLMRGLIQAAKEQGLKYIDGYVLANNRPMLGLMTYLGFQNDPDPDDRSVRRVWLGI